jgi:hypothetical protein
MYYTSVTFDHRIKVKVCSKNKIPGIVCFKWVFVCVVGSDKTVNVTEFSSKACNDNDKEISASEVQVVQIIS